MRPYRVVCKAGSEAWLDARHDLLTATDLSAMLGLNPYKTDAQVLREKAVPRDQLPEFRETRYISHGRYDEEHNMGKFSHITGIRTRHTPFLLASTLYPGLACSLDGVAKLPSETVDLRGKLRGWTSRDWSGPVERLINANPGAFVIAEMKQVDGMKSRPQWQKNLSPPRHYWAQVQCQLHVTGYDYGFLIGQVGAADMLCYVIEKETSDEFVGEIKRAVERVAETVASRGTQG